MSDSPTNLPTGPAPSKIDKLRFIHLEQFKTNMNKNVMVKCLITEAPSDSNDLVFVADDENGEQFSIICYTSTRPVVGNLITLVGNVYNEASVTMINFFLLPNNVGPGIPVHRPDGPERAYNNSNDADDSTNTTLSSNELHDTQDGTSPADANQEVDWQGSINVDARNNDAEGLNVETEAYMAYVGHGTPSFAYSPIAADNQATFRGHTPRQIIEDTPDVGIYHGTPSSIGSALSEQAVAAPYPPIDANNQDMYRGCHPEELSVNKGPVNEDPVDEGPAIYRGHAHYRGAASAFVDGYPASRQSAPMYSREGFDQFLADDDGQKFAQGVVGNALERASDTGTITDRPISLKRKKSCAPTDSTRVESSTEEAPVVPHCKGCRCILTVTETTENQAIDWQPVSTKEDHLDVFKDRHYKR